MDKHRVLVVGVGSIGERHLRCFQATGRCLVGCCEPNESLRSTIDARYDVLRSSADLDGALQAEQYDAAVIATPAQLHVPIARRLADEGIHLLIEKPLSTSTDGIDQLTRVVAERSVAVAVAYTQRSHPAVDAVKRSIDEGRFGKPLQITVASGQHFPTYRPAYREIYYVDRETGGGAVQDGMTHMVNLAEWLVGPVDRVVTDADHLALPGVTVEDTVHTLARHGNVMGSYALNQHQAPNETMITVVCEQGTLRIDHTHMRWSWMREPSTEWQHETVEIPDRDTLFVRQAHSFLDFVEGAAEPLCSLSEGIQTLHVNLAQLRSLESGGWEKVGPKIEAWHTTR